MLSYNRSAAYLRIVLTWLAVYRNGTLVLPRDGRRPDPGRRVTAGPGAYAVPPSGVPPTGTSAPQPVPPPVPGTTTPPPLPVLVTDPLTGVVCRVDGVLDVGGALIGGLLGVPVPPSPGENCLP